MRHFVLALTLTYVLPAAANAGALAVVTEEAPYQLAQSRSAPDEQIIPPAEGDYRTDRRRDRDRFQRYVCVVPPPQSSGRQRPYVCNADPGRIGGRCRCPGMVGSGNLDFGR